MDGEKALRSVLRRIRRRWFLLEWSRVLTWTAITAAVSICAAGVAARLANIEEGGLLALAGGTVTVTGVVFLLAAWPLRRRPSDRRVARFVEERCPELEDSVASAVDLLDQRTPSRFDGLVLDDAGSRVRSLDLDRVIPRGALRQRCIVAIAALAVAIAMMVVFRDSVGRAALTLRYVVVPPRLALQVEPGNVRVAEGADVTVRARVLGAPAGWRVDTPVLRTTAGGEQHAMALEADGDAYRLELSGLRSVTNYQVRAGKLASEQFTIDVRHPPHVARIDLSYTYPAFSGLPPRMEEDGGDIFGPAGTKVSLLVHSDRRAAGGRIALSDGRWVELTPSPRGTFDGELSIAAEGSYRIVLRDAEGVASRGDTEYFIRVMDDRPPDVRLVRPTGDRRVTPLEEVSFEARADDDHGVDRLDLIVAVRGNRERVIPLHRGAPVTAASGQYTLFLEDLDVRPGDFVSYYARARDVSRGKRSTEARSDIFFLEVRPFTEEFEVAQSQAFMAGGGGSFDDLAAQQKNVVIATWKLERRSAAGRSRSDIEAIARAQAEVRKRAQGLAMRIGSGGPAPPGRRDPGGQAGAQELDGEPSVLQRAVEAMGRAQKELEALNTRAAIPHEMEALNNLLRAEAEVRRTQIARQQSTGGGRADQSGNQDLSALFDRELERQQQTNYENRSAAADTEARREENDPLEKLRELARRQDDLSRRQQELARRRPAMTPDETKRQLERLTREQQELQRRAEQLARRLSRQGDEAGSEQEGRESTDAAQAVRDAAREMGQAAGDLQQGNAGAAGGKSARAVDRLQEAERHAANRQPDERRRAAGDAQLDLQQLAQAQRRLAHEAAGSDGADTWRRLAAEQDRLADQTDRIARNVRDLSAGAPSGDPIRQASRDLDREGIGERMRSSARGMRDAGRTDPSKGGQAGQPLGREAEHLADALERAARALSAASGRDPNAQRLAERLARAREARERLAEVERRIEQEAARVKQGEERTSQSGDRARTPGGRIPREGARGVGELQSLQQEYARRLADAQRALSDARGDVPEFAEGFSTPTEWQPSRSAPGTEAFKQDFARWDELRREISSALERVEAALSAKLNEQASRERMAADADDRAPEAYRRQIARYYESITKKERR